VGSITEPEQPDGIIRAAKADIVPLARESLKFFCRRQIIVAATGSVTASIVPFLFRLRLLPLGL
jgi:hypothetical protein